jgi:hypothetical protein
MTPLSADSTVRRPGASDTHTGDRFDRISRRTARAVIIVLTVVEAFLVLAFLSNRAHH